MLDIQNHDIILRKILRDIFEDKYLQGILGFKGGTCLYIFYNLDRFSTDLDFNLLSDTFDPTRIETILKKYIDIEESREKYFTWFWLGHFEKGKQKIKIEISKRDYPDKYINSDFYGLTVKTMAPDFMFSHKLCAISDRSQLANRDLYDAHFMFKNNFKINEEIIRLRTGKSIREYFEYLISYIQDNVDENYILQGLGEVLDERKKVWVKNNLLRELLFELNIRRDTY